MNLEQMQMLSDREVLLTQLDHLRTIEKAVNAAFAEPIMCLPDDPGLGEGLDQIHKRLMLMTQRVVNSLSEQTETIKAAVTT